MKVAKIIGYEGALELIKESDRRGGIKEERGKEDVWYHDRIGDSFPILNELRRGGKGPVFCYTVKRPDNEYPPSGFVNIIDCKVMDE